MDKLRIGLGTLFLVPGKLGGLESYVRGLIQGIAEFDLHNEYIIIANKENASTWKNLPNNFSVLECPIYGAKKAFRTIYERFFLNKYLEKLNLNIYHSLSMTIPPKIKNRKTIVTLGDIIYKKFPDEFGFIQKMVADYSIHYAVLNSDAIVTFSEYSKKDIVEEYLIPSDKVRVALLAANKLYFTEDSVKDYFTNNKIPSKYIFSVSSTYYHKNLARLLDAFSYIVKEKSKDYKLVITGLKMKGHNEFIEKIKTSGLEDYVIFTGWIEDSVLAALYKKASCFVYPSLYEGFGLPVLEAMGFGTPIVCSNTTSLPEVGGDAVLYCNPEDSKDIAEKIITILEDEGLRTKLQRKAVEQLQKFSWKKCAKDTLTAYGKKRS